MCLAVYLATPGPLPARDRAPLTLEPAAPETAARLRRHLAGAHLCYVASHEGCGCGFLVEREGTDEEISDRHASLGALRELVEEVARAGGGELLLCADGAEAEPPRRALALDDPEALRLREGEAALYRIAALPSRATRADLPAWLALAAEVEPLFGPMVAEPGFRAALEAAIAAGDAFCLRAAAGAPGAPLDGAIALSREARAVEWLAVCGRARGRGLGAALLRAGLARLGEGPVSVTTFAQGIDAGAPARRLYLAAGFCDAAPAEPTPTGYATVRMVRP